MEIKHNFSLLICCLFENKKLQTNSIHYKNNNNHIFFNVAFRAQLHKNKYTGDPDKSSSMES